jgi:hypothetical protein
MAMHKKTVGQESQRAYNVKSDVKYILDSAPRLLNVAGATAISFALGQGVNRALLETDLNTDRREIASGYRGDCAFTAVSRLSLLLDRDPSLVSFQPIYTKLQSDATVTLLVEVISEDSIFPSSVAAEAREAIKRFLKIYRSIDWQDLHGRLVHFRNRGIAHLTPQKIEKRVTYAEVETLARAVAIMGECMVPFVKDAVPLREDEIEEWSDRACAVWKAVLS